MSIWNVLSIRGKQGISTIWPCTKHIRKVAFYNQVINFIFTQYHTYMYKMHIWPKKEFYMYVCYHSYMDVGCGGRGGYQIRKSRSQLHLKISVTVSVYFTNKGVNMFSLNMTALVSTPFSTEISKGSTIFFHIPNHAK